LRVEDIGNADADTGIFFAGFRITLMNDAFIDGLKIDKGTVGNFGYVRL